ncbi:MAG: polymerase subunit alpha, partial [Solirubrobacterales bacterium]|nr:polymerase subunit alpha [Solirubrobacterales bacterium]
SELSHSAIDGLKRAIGDYPGPTEVLLDISTSAGTRRLRLGREYRVQHTPTLLAELEHALSPPLPNAASG